jgi:hypothetical protein
MRQRRILGRLVLAVGPDDAFERSQISWLDRPLDAAAEHAVRVDQELQG